jgi:hypothetical protein
MQNKGMGLQYIPFRSECNSDETNGYYGRFVSRRRPRPSSPSLSLHGVAQGCPLCHVKLWQIGTPHPSLMRRTRTSWRVFPNTCIGEQSMKIRNL